jgi:hypothetical protein
MSARFKEAGAGRRGEAAVATFRESILWPQNRRLVKLLS